MEIDEDDISDWIRGSKIDKFRSALDPDGRRRAMSLSDLSDFSIKIVRVFKKLESRKREMQEWLDVLLLRDDGMNRGLLDRLIMLSAAKNATDTRKNTAAAAYELFRILVRKYPKLLLSKTPDKRRSLFHEAAFRGSHDIIILCMEEIQTQHASSGALLISDLVMSEDQNGQSALHLAVASGASETVTSLLAYCRLDDKTTGMTATLVCAVKSRSYDIVEAILRRTKRVENSTTGDSGRMPHENPPPHEVYRAHWVEMEMLEEAVANESKNILELLTSLRPEILQHPDCMLLHDAVMLDLADIAGVLLKVCPELATRLQSRDGGSPNADQVELEEISVLSLIQKGTRNGEKIKSLILPILMRLLSISDIRRHLKGGTWNEIYLDLTYLKHKPAYLRDFLASVSQDISQVSTKDSQPKPDLTSVSYSPGATFNVEFESALKYIEIPLFNKKADAPRTEATMVLIWLRTVKGVKNVFELRVADSFYDPHREEDIELALKDLDVRELDWRRPDLSIHTVKSCAPKVEHLWLYASGSLAIIDHWLGPNGICQLTNLTQLNIVIIEDNISMQRRLRCLEMVRKFMDDELSNIHWAIKTEPWDISSQPPPDASAGASMSKSAPISVAGLQHFLDTYTAFQDLEMLPKRVPNTRTKVAILDTGVSKGLFPGSGHTVYGAGFSHRNPGPNERESPWWLATDPHGSYVANIISQLDPRCELYIAQIAVYKDEISLKSVVKAFEWAISQGVQVINCSFVLFKKDADLERQISIAAGKGIIIVCSTADEGYIRQDVWPAKYHFSKFSNIFPIAACDFKGKLTGYSSETSATYRLQGEQIDASHAQASLMDEATKGIVSGSSVATAMASGVASLILACEGMVRVFEENPVPRSRVQVVANTFKKMCAPDTKDKEPMFITPSLVFPSRQDFFADNQHFSRWIKAFGRSLSA